MSDEPSTPGELEPVSPPLDLGAAAADQAWVRGLVQQYVVSDEALTDTTRPEPAGMPDHVWARMQQVIGEQTVLGAPQGVEGAGHRIGRSWWGGGIAAAIVLIGAVGIGAASLSSSSSTPIAAGPTRAPQAHAHETTAGLAGPASGVGAFTANPAGQLMASGTDYQAPTLDQQLVSTVKGALGIAHASQVGALSPAPRLNDTMSASAQSTSPASTGSSRASVAQSGVAALPAASGFGTTAFTSTPKAMQTCLDAITHATGDRALLIDLARWNGQAAAVLLVPTWQQHIGASAQPTAQITTGAGVLDVWVVDTGCTPMSTTSESIIWTW